MSDGKIPFRGAILGLRCRPEFVGDAAEAPLRHVVDVADGGESLGQPEAAHRVHDVLLQALLLLRLLRPLARVLLALLSEARNMQSLPIKGA